jgi:hypothetical protein
VTAYFVRQDAARQAGAGTRTLQVALRAAAPKVDGKLDDWAKAAWVTLDDTTQAAVSIAGDRLYAAYRTQDRNLLANTGEVPTALFKCGGALDLMLGTDSKADGKRGTPVAGDLRLLVTQVRGKTAAVLYRPVVPGTREPVPFSSPWRTITIDRVDDVSAQVALAGGKRREEVVKRGKVAAVLNWGSFRRPDGASPATSASSAAARATRRNACTGTTSRPASSTMCPAKPCSPHSSGAAGSSWRSNRGRGCAVIAHLLTEYYHDNSNVDITRLPPWHTGHAVLRSSCGRLPAVSAC